MASESQRKAARKNIKKVARASKRKRMIAHLSKATRIALGKQGANPDASADLERSGIAGPALCQLQ